jgi:putative transcriptional regulator
MHVKDPAQFKRKRVNRRYTQRELAMLVRRTQTTIWAIENGTLTNISEDLALALAARLEVDWEELFDLREAEAVNTLPNDMHTTGHAALAATA